LTIGSVAAYRFAMLPDLTPAEVLAVQRRRRDLTQEQAAELVGISASFWHLIETGQKNPGLATALAIEKVFEIPPSAWVPQSIEAAS